MRNNFSDFPWELKFLTDTSTRLSIFKQRYIVPLTENEPSTSQVEK